MSRKANPRLIGAFVLSALVLLAIAIVLFASGPLFKKTTTFVAYFDGSVAGLTAGSAVKFRGVTVGSVSQIRLAIDEMQLDSIEVRAIGQVPQATIDSVDAAASDQREAEAAIQDLADSAAQAEAELYFRIPVIFELDENLLTRQGAAVDLDDPNVVSEWISMGMRAFLASESLVTGQKYIALDIFSGTPVELSPFTRLPYPEIPTTKTGFEEIGKEVQAVLKKLAEVDVDSLVGSLVATVQGLEELANDEGLRQAFSQMPQAVNELSLALGDIRHLVESVDSTVTPLRGNIESAIESLDETMASFAATARSLQDVVSPGSPLVYRLDMTLEEMERTAVSLRALVEYLERNPSAIVRGKPKGN